MPAGEQHALEPEPVDRLGRVLALPLAGVAADEDQRGRRRHPLARLGERLEQQRQALDLREAADVDDHRPAAERVQLGLPVADAAGLLAGPPAARLLDEHAPPDRAAVDLDGRNVSGSKPLGSGLKRSESTPSSRTARSRLPGATTIRSQRAAHVHSRCAQAAPCAQRPGRARSPRASSARCRAGGRRPGRPARRARRRRSAASDGAGGARRRARPRPRPAPAPRPRPGPRRRRRRARRRRGRAPPAGPRTTDAAARCRAARRTPSARARPARR